MSFDYRNIFSRNNIMKFIKNIMILTLIMAFCTMASLLFKHIEAYESNIVMIYLLGVLIFSYIAKAYLYSFLASLCSVLLYNFFFTAPYFTFQVYSQHYLVTFVVMFIVGFVTSMLTIKVEHETKIAEDREERVKDLYYIGKSLLGIKNNGDLAKVSSEEIGIQFKANILMQFLDSEGNICLENIEGDNIFNDDIEHVACMEAYKSGNPCGCGTMLFSECKSYYKPIISQSGVLGVIGISLKSLTPLTNVQKEFLDAIVPQIAIVLEREQIYEKQQKTEMEFQRERLRADMLRSISHDLRTPLTGIMGLTSTMISNYDSVNDDIKKNFLHNIYDEADWLNELVENILNTTRFEEGRCKLNIEQEAAEEIISEAISHVKKRAEGYKISAKIPDEIVLIQVDGVLIRQVLINLLNNAISYSPEGSEILILLEKEKERVVFKIIDNGTGISENDLPHIFERFYPGNGKNRKGRTGIGLGLSLCKSIIEAHGGKIYVTNNIPHGTIVNFYVPKGVNF